MAAGSITVDGSDVVTGQPAGPYIGLDISHAGSTFLWRPTHRGVSSWDTGTRRNSGFTALVFSASVCLSQYVHYHSSVVHVCICIYTVRT